MSRGSFNPTEFFGRPHRRKSSLFNLLTVVGATVMAWAAKGVGADTFYDLSTTPGNHIYFNDITASTQTPEGVVVVGQKEGATTSGVVEERALSGSVIRSVDINDGVLLDRQYGIDHIVPMVTGRYAIAGTVRFTSPSANYPGGAFIGELNADLSVVPGSGIVFPWNVTGDTTIRAILPDGNRIVGVGDTTQLPSGGQGNADSFMFDVSMTSHTVNSFYLFGAAGTDRVRTLAKVPGGYTIGGFTNSAPSSGFDGFLGFTNSTRFGQFSFSRVGESSNQFILSTECVGNACLFTGEDESQRAVWTGTFDPTNFGAPVSSEIRQTVSAGVTTATGRKAVVEGTELKVLYTATNGSRVTGGVLFYDASTALNPTGAVAIASGGDDYIESMANIGRTTWVAGFTNGFASSFEGVAGQPVLGVSCANFSQEVLAVGLSRRASQGLIGFVPVEVIPPPGERLNLTATPSGLATRRICFAATPQTTDAATAIFTALVTTLMGSSASSSSALPSSSGDKDDSTTTIIIAIAAALFIILCLGSLGFVAARRRNKKNTSSAGASLELAVPTATNTYSTQRGNTTHDTGAAEIADIAFRGQQIGTDFTVLLLDDRETFKLQEQLGRTYDSSEDNYIEIARGNFGAAFVGRANGEFCCVKLVENTASNPMAIELSRDEADKQNALGGLEGISELLFYGDVTVDGRRRLMTVTRLGNYNGEELQRSLFALRSDTATKNKMAVDVLKGLLMGASKMHDEGTRHPLNGAPVSFEGNTIHRDIKPNNYIVRIDPATQEVHIELIDFGASEKCSGGYSVDDDTGKSDLRYLDPARVQNLTTKNGFDGKASDVFAIALTVLMQLIGRHPFIDINGIDGPEIQRVKAKKAELEPDVTQLYAKEFQRTGDSKFDKTPGQIAAIVQGILIKEHWSEAFMQECLGAIPELQIQDETNIYYLLRQLLSVDTKVRLSATDALRSKVFTNPNNQFASDAERVRVYTELQEGISPTSGAAAAASAEDYQADGSDKMYYQPADSTGYNAGASDGADTGLAGLVTAPGGPGTFSPGASNVMHGGSVGQPAQVPYSEGALYGNRDAPPLSEALTASPGGTKASPPGVSLASPGMCQL